MALVCRSVSARDVGLRHPAVYLAQLAQRTSTKDQLRRPVAHGLMGARRRTLVTIVFFVGLPIVATVRVQATRPGAFL